MIAWARSKCARETGRPLSVFLKANFKNHAKQIKHIRVAHDFVVKCIHRNVSFTEIHPKVVHSLPRREAAFAKKSMDLYKQTQAMVTSCFAAMKSLFKEFRRGSGTAFAVCLRLCSDAARVFPFARRARRLMPR